MIARRLGSVVVAVVVGALGAARPAGAAGPALAGATTVTADRSAFVEVTLPRPVTLDWHPLASQNKTFALRGGGRLAAVMLKQDGAPAANPAVAFAGRFDPAIFCSGACAKPVDAVSVLAFGNSVESTDAGWTLPAGDYRLYLISASGPASATITLPELAGQASLVADRAVPVKTAVSPRRDSLPADNVAVFGDSGALPEGGGVVFDVAGAYDRAGAGDSWESCGYHSAPASPFAWYPTCPTTGDEEADDGRLSSIIVSGSPLFDIYSGLTLLPRAGPYGPGGNMTSAYTVDSLGWAAAWIGLEPTAQAAAPATLGAIAQPIGEAPAAAEPASVHAPSPPAPGQAALARRRVHASRTVALVALRCAAPQGCRGMLRFAGGRAAPYALAGASTATVHVPLTRALARRLRHARRARATLLVAGAPAPARLTIIR